MMQDADHVSLVRCVDEDENVYDLTRVVQYVISRLEKGPFGRRADSELYLYDDKPVKVMPNGSYEILVKGRPVNVREISPD